MTTLTRTCLAERTHIYVDWLAPTLTGSIAFDNVWMLGLPDAAGYVAKDAQPAPALTLDVAEALAFAMPLPEPTSTITGEHVAMYLRRLHAAKLVERAEAEAAAERAAAEQAEAQAAAEKAAQVPP